MTADLNTHHTSNSPAESSDTTSAHQVTSTGGFDGGSVSQHDLARTERAHAAGALASADTGGADHRGNDGRRRGRKAATLFVVGVVAVVLAAGAVFVVRGGSGEALEVDDESTRTPPETATVDRGDLTAEHDFRGTVGYGDEWTIELDGGIVTDRQPLGTLVEFGKPLVTIDELPVLLAEGTTPMYRDLELLPTPMVGADVAQLQQMLIGLGFDRGGDLVADGKFGRDTKRAIEDWQKANWWPATGRVGRAEIVFSPTPLRIASDLRVGATFAGVEVSEWAPTVTVDIANRDRHLLQVDTDVTLELDDGTTATGTVTDQRTVTADDGSTSTRVTIAPVGVTGDATSARVVVTNTVATDVLLVPVGALLAVAEGGYALEVLVTPDDADGDVPGAPTTRLVEVQIGDILDGRVEVTGDISVGDHVVVAG